MELLTANSKIRKTGKHFGVKLLNFGITAYKSKSTGRIICPFASSCVKYCYAQKGAYVFGNVAPVFERRYLLTLERTFEEEMSNEIRKKKPNFIRVHDSGDFYSREYLNKWLRIARTFPEVKFYAYTNSLNLIREASIPGNFDFIFSDGGKLAHTIDKEEERHSIVFQTKDDMIAAGYVDSSEYDLYATKWFNDTNKVGLLMH